MAIPSFAQTSVPLNCNGYPRSTTTVMHNSLVSAVQVCRLVPFNAPLTPSLTVTSPAGDVFAAGAATTGAIAGTARVIAQDTTNARATALAQRVTIQTSGGVVTYAPQNYTLPQQVSVDVSVTTPAATRITLRSSAGDLSASGYNATLDAATSAGNVAAASVSGRVVLRSNAGDIRINLTAGSWVGAGLTATTAAGDVTVTRPAGYAATFTAQAPNGTVVVDGTPHGAGPVTFGSGAPIRLSTSAGDVTIGH